MVNTVSSWETESDWEREDGKTPKQVLMRYIIDEVQQDTTKADLLDRKVLEFIKQNGLPSFKKSEVVNMIDWAIKTFLPPNF